jgi:VCBS repeat-containing protein
MGARGRFAGLCAIVFWAAAAGAQSNLIVTVRHAPALIGSGRVEGSVQQLLGESVTLNGGFTLTGDLLVPGTPTLKINGNPTFAGTIVGTGSASPSGHKVTLNGNVSLRYLVTRTNPVALPTVPPPPAPAGTRSVTINSPGQSYGDPATLRNLTLNGGVGQVAVPPGTYGNFVANGGSGFTFGVAGATTPAVYNLQNFTLNGGTRVEVIGPIILTVASGFTANGLFGTTNQSDWLQLQLSSGGFTLNGGCTVHGSVVAPAGTVTVNGNSCLIGSVKSDRLTLNGNGCIKGGAVTVNQPPVASAQSVTTAEDTAASVMLAGTDAEGAPLTFTVLTPPTRGTLSGIAPNLTYTPALNENGSDSFTFKVNDGAQDSAAATVSITITPVNDAPVAQSQSLSTAEDTAAPVTLVGSDVEGSALAYTVVTPPTHGVLLNPAPGLLYVPDPNYHGPDSFTFRVNDGALDSAPATVSITVSALNDRPVADAQSLATDEDTALPVPLTGTDVENDPLTFTVLTPPSHGTLTGTPPNLSYLPATNFHGADSATARAKR